MKMTLLQMVKSIMSDMDSDAVDHVTDTVESGQVASTIRDVYYQMITNQVIPEEETLGNMLTVDLLSFPGALNYLETPEFVDEVLWIKYDVIKAGDTTERMTEIKYVNPHWFMTQVNLNPSDGSNVVEVTDPTSGIPYFVLNDQAPTCYTSFDDTYIAFNQFDQGVDTVQVLGEKSQTMFKIPPDFDITLDDFTPVMDANLFPFLLAEAKSTCFVNLKQQANPKVEKQSREQRIRVQKSKFKTDSAQKASTSSSGPSYGRR